MLLSTARKSNKGFTLIEMLIIVAVIGILAAISAPSFLAWLNRKKVEDSLVQVQGALKVAQREAIRKSTTCTVTLSTSSVTSPCLVTGDRTLPTGVELSTDISLSKITYSFRGNTANGGTTVLRMPDGSTSEQRCLVTSVGVGLMRTGNYSGTFPGGTCNTSEQQI